MYTESLKENVISLFPRTWEQKHNKNRIILLEEQLDKLTGKDYLAYNMLLDYIENNDYSSYCRLVENLNESINSV